MLLDELNKLQRLLPIKVEELEQEKIKLENKVREANFLIEARECELQEFKTKIAILDSEKLSL